MLCSRVQGLLLLLPLKFPFLAQPSLLGLLLAFSHGFLVRFAFLDTT
jgi:hypothetical protein